MTGDGRPISLPVPESLRCGAFRARGTPDGLVVYTCSEPAGHPPGAHVWRMEDGRAGSGTYAAGVPPVRPGSG
jgi:hypothetical protein